MIVADRRAPKLTPGAPRARLVRSGLLPFQPVPPPLRFDGVMTQPAFIPSDERIVDTMIGLARIAKSHRIILAGSISFEMFVELHRRGYRRVTTTRICHVPCGQHDVAFITWPGPSFGVLEAALDGLVHFLSAAGW